MRIPIHGVVASSLLALPVPAQGVAYEWSPVSGPRAVASAGDVDGDGANDFAIATQGQGSSLGRVEVRSGEDGGLLWEISGAKQGDGFGATLASLGDVDGDGIDDLAVAATYVFPFGLGPAPYLRAISGLDGSTLWEVQAATVNESIGRSLARIEDVDGDGFDDLIVGVDFGEVQARSGANGALVYDVPTPAGAGDDYGACVAALGDLDGDGLEDFGVGDPGAQSGQGRVNLHSGFDGGLIRSIDPPVQGPAWFGKTFDGLGDLSGDGIPDLVVGAPASAITTPASGIAWILSGADGAVLHALAPAAGLHLEGFGTKVAATEDVDGDGIADVRLSAGVYPYSPQINLTAELLTHSGATGALLQRWEGLSTSEFAVVPDANGDGRSDVLHSSGASVKVVLDGLANPVSLAACPGQASPNGCVPQVLAKGTPSLTQFADLEFHVSKLPVDTVGVCLYGADSAALPFGSGVLCVAPPFLRKSMQSPTLFGNSCAAMTSAGTKCRLTKLDLAALGLAAGDEFYVQSWFRDTGAPPPNLFGLSGALAIQLWP